MKFKYHDFSREFYKVVLRLLKLENINLGELVLFWLLEPYLDFLVRGDFRSLIFF